MVATNSRFQEVPIYGSVETLTISQPSPAELERQRIIRNKERYEREQFRTRVTLSCIGLTVFLGLFFGTLKGCSMYKSNMRRIERYNYVTPINEVDKSIVIGGEDVSLNTGVSEGVIYNSEFLDIRYRDITFRGTKGGYLTDIFIHHENGEHEWVPKSKLKEYDKWQDQYQSLIDRIAIAKKNKENDALMGLEARIE